MLKTTKLIITDPQIRNDAETLSATEITTNHLNNNNNKGKLTIAVVQYKVLTAKVIQKVQNKQMKQIVN